MIAIGDIVRITRGPLANLKGEVVDARELHNGPGFVVRIQDNYLTEFIPGSNLEKVQE